MINSEWSTLVSRCSVVVLCPVRGVVSVITHMRRLRNVRVVESYKLIQSRPRLCVSILQVMWNVAICVEAGREF
jgi:hypothetical protein